jgi:hypothetical protein
MSKLGSTVKQVPFKAMSLPGRQHTFVPADLDILIPKARRILAAERHHLAYLPWQNSYLNRIPADYQAFFKFVLPHLHARTSNVHTAVSIGELQHIFDGTTAQVEKRLIYLALILHDCGWSQVTQADLVKSFNYNGVSPVGADSMQPKQKHLVYGEALAYKLLDSFGFTADPLTSHDIYTISEMIRRHDHDATWEQGKYGDISLEIKIMCDADRLWSYTYENFWLDTIRKNVPADAYLDLINAEIKTYFFTAAGRARARKLIEARRIEVAAYQTITKDASLRTELINKARLPAKRALYRAQQLVLSAKSRRIQKAHIRENAY